MGRLVRHRSPYHIHTVNILQYTARYLGALPRGLNSVLRNPKLAAHSRRGSDTQTFVVMEGTQVRPDRQRVGSRARIVQIS